MTVDQAKSHLRIDGNDQDSDIEDLISAAREEVEDFTSRCCMPQTLKMYMDGFPGGTPFEGWIGAYRRHLTLEAILSQTVGQILIPRAPLIGVDSIKYIDTQGVTQTLDPANYTVDPQGDDQPVRILPAYGKVWPATRIQANAVTVQFQAGYADADHVPRRIKLAMKQTIGDWWENREAVVLGSANAPYELPNAAKKLLWKIRLF